MNRMSNTSDEKIKALKAAFPGTIPVMTGYIFLGMAFGILLNAKGYGIFWALLMSLFIYAGSMQYVVIHSFYGLSMLDKFKNTGKLKSYLIFGLTDETFSVLCGIEPAADVSRPWYMFWVTLLDQFYWVAGSAVGSLLGSVLSFNTKGLDFVLTALFVVIFVGQWQETDNHIPAVIGVVVTLLCRIFFGTGSFLIPAMIGILICLSLAEKQRREVG